MFTGVYDEYSNPPLLISKNSTMQCLRAFHSAQIKEYLGMFIKVTDIKNRQIRKIIFTF